MLWLWVQRVRGEQGGEKLLALLLCADKLQGDGMGVGPDDAAGQLQQTGGGLGLGVAGEEEMQCGLGCEGEGGVGIEFQADTGEAEVDYRHIMDEAVAKKQGDTDGAGNTRCGTSVTFHSVSPTL